MAIAGNCFCCLESYNKTTHYRVICDNYLDDKTPCAFESCRLCVRKYILGSGSTAQCMNCKKPFTRHFLIGNLTRSWCDNAYAIYKNGLLLDTEKARCPENMQEAANYKKIIPLEQKKKVLQSERAKLYMALRQMDQDIYRHTRLIHNFKNFNMVKKEKKKKFIRRCPVNECKGFLSTRWKCELCNTQVCNKCLEVKINIEEDANYAAAEHVCKEADIKTAELLKTDTKPCPSCGEMIMKISGCDQMWCPSCKNAWSWARGVVVHGVIHNPHYYEFQRQTNNGHIPRNLGDVPCGGLPDHYNWRMKVLHKRTSSAQREKWTPAIRNLFMILNNLHRKANHYQYVIINPLTDKLTHLRDNKQLRVLYMVDVLKESNFKQKLGVRDIEIEKIMSVLQIYQLFNTILTENIISIYNIDRPTNGVVEELELVEVARCLRNIEDARYYVNRELSKIAFLYKRAIKIITCEFNVVGLNITSKKKLKEFLDQKKPDNKWFNSFLPKQFHV